MQVFCGNCQLSFQAPDGATGLVCPICRNPLRAPDAAAAPNDEPARQTLDWNGGTLDDLIALLSAPAWSARVEVLPASGETAIGEVHVIAGGVSEAIHDGKSTHDALDKLRASKGARFRVEPRLPNPSDGDLTFPGPDHGRLEERPLATLMRYCEDYVLTAGIEVWRGTEDARVDYRRGEIVGVTVGGIDAPERLAEVMKWASGSYRLIAPKLTLPETAPKAAPPAVVAAKSAGAANKTIFGMPALDPAAIAMAAERIKAGQGQPSQAKGSAPAAARSAESPAGSRLPGATAHVGNARAAVGEPAVPSVPATAASAAVSGPAAAAPAANDASSKQAVAKTLFGVQPGSVVPPQAAAAPPVGASSPRGTTPVPVSAGAAGPTDAAKAARPASSAPSGQAAAPRAAVTRPNAPTVQTTTALDHPAPTKVAKTRTTETPVWTYVGVGFIFGMALLGVYRLVMVLAH